MRKQNKAHGQKLTVKQKTKLISQCMMQWSPAGLYDNVLYMTIYDDHATSKPVR